MANLQVKDAGGNTVYLSCTGAGSDIDPNVSVHATAVTDIIPGVSALKLGKAEDSAHTSGDVGVMLLAVREAAATDLSAGNTDGDYEPLQVDSLGRLWSRGVGHGTLFKVNPTVDTSAYGANDIVGGVQTIASFAQVTGGSAVLNSLAIFDAGNQKAAMQILFFDATPSGGTYADQGAVTWAAGDAAKFIGKVEVLTADFTSFGTQGVAVYRNLNMPLSVAATSLFALIITTGTPTYTAATNLHLVLGVRY